MRILCLLLSIMSINLYSSELPTLTELTHPLLKPISSNTDQVEFTLKIDPNNISSEVYNLLRAVTNNGLEIDVKHSDSSVVQQILDSIKSEAQDFSHLYAKTKKPFRLLSLDGGGIRGFMTCLFLSHLTHLTNKPVHELFDMIVATSTGTFIAAGLGMKRPENSTVKVPDSDLLIYKDSVSSIYYTPEELAALYLTDGPVIFSGGGWFSSWSGPKYQDTGLNKVIKKYFGDALLTDLAIPVVLTSYNLHSRNLEPYSSFQNNTTNSKIFVREAIRACVAAPTVFAPSMVGKEIKCDAGIVKNNPAALGIAIATHELKVDPRNIVLLSLGCGHCVDLKPLDIYKSMGVTGWAGEFLSSIFDGQVDHQIIQTLHMSGTGPGYYLRLSPLMDLKYMETDVTTQANYSGLSDATRSEIARHRHDFNKLAEVLTGTKPDIFQSIPDLKPRAIPMSIDVPELFSAESTPNLRKSQKRSSDPNRVLEGIRQEKSKSSIRRSVSLPSLRVEDLPRQLQTGRAVSDDESIHLERVHDLQESSPDHQ